MQGRAWANLGDRGGGRPAIGKPVPDPWHTPSNEGGEQEEEEEEEEEEEGSREEEPTARGGKSNTYGPQPGRKVEHLWPPAGPQLKKNCCTNLAPRRPN